MYWLHRYREGTLSINMIGFQDADFPVYSLKINLRQDSKINNAPCKNVSLQKARVVKACKLMIVQFISGSISTPSNHLLSLW